VVEFCLALVLPRVTLPIGVSAQNGIEAQGIDSLQQCIKKCVVAGGGVPASVSIQLPSMYQLCSLCCTDDGDDYGNDDDCGDGTRWQQCRFSSVGAGIMVWWAVVVLVVGGCDGIVAAVVTRRRRRRHHHHHHHHHPHHHRRHHHHQF